MSEVSAIHPASPLGSHETCV